MSEIRHHIADEEGEMFAHMRQVIDAEDMRRLGGRVAAFKKVAPTGRTRTFRTSRFPAWRRGREHRCSTVCATSRQGAAPTTDAAIRRPVRPLGASARANREHPARLRWRADRSAAPGLRVGTSRLGSVTRTTRSQRSSERGTPRARRLLRCGTGRRRHLDLDHACSKQDRLVMVIARFVYTAAVMVIVVWLLRAGNPVGGLVIVPAMAVWLRRDAHSGRLAARVRRAIHQ